MSCLVSFVQVMTGCSPNMAIGQPISRFLPVSDVLPRMKKGEGKVLSTATHLDQSTFNGERELSESRRSTRSFCWGKALVPQPHIPSLRVLMRLLGARSPLTLMPLTSAILTSGCRVCRDSVQCPSPGDFRGGGLGRSRFSSGGSTRSLATPSRC